jgi:hypothetical protein
MMFCTCGCGSCDRKIKSLQKDLGASEEELKKLAKQYVDSRAIEGCQEKKIESLEKQLSDAAMQINCAGPVPHRIRVLRKEMSEANEKLQAEMQLWKDEAIRLDIVNVGLMQRKAELESKVAKLLADFPKAPPLPTVDCKCRTCEFLRERQARKE